MRDILKTMAVVMGVAVLILLIHIMKAEANQTYEIRLGWAFIGVFGLFSILTTNLVMTENTT